MGLDVKKILDDLNPSEKVMKWLIVALIASVTIIFGWGIKRGKSINDLEGLQKDVISLTLKVEALQKNTPRAIEAEISNEIKDVKIIVFKEIDELEAELNDKITLVVSSQGEVTKEWLLKAIDIRARQNSNFRVFSAASEVKSLSIESPMYNEDAPIQMATDDTDRFDVYEIMEIKTELEFTDPTYIADSIRIADSVELHIGHGEYSDLEETTVASPSKKKFSFKRLFRRNK